MKLAVIEIDYFIVNMFIYTACTTGDIRLVGGMNEMEGRVEVCVNNQWGTICDRNWEAAEAAVACRQAGFSDRGW